MTVWVPAEAKDVGEHVKPLDKLRVEENDTAPGCREMEEVFCPVCHEEVTKVFTSGMPVAFVVRE